jgi:DNA-binding CsgD family transcriptional regulator
VRKSDIAMVVSPFGGVVALDELARLRLVQETPSGIVAVSWAQVIEDLLTDQALALRHAVDEMLLRQRQIRMLLRAGETLDSDLREGVRTLTVDTQDSGSGMYDLPSHASNELMALHPGGHFQPEVLERSLHRAIECMDDGARLRVVHQASALAHPAAIEYLSAIEDCGGLVRVRQHLPFRILIVDRNVAVCSAPGEDSDQGTFLIRGTRIMALLDRVFETTWVDSVPLRAMLGQREPGLNAGDAATAIEDRVLAQQFANLSSQQTTILRYLAEGETDRTIARRLGVTARTVTRRIAEVYEVLQVESRFQAGAAAHRLGLV